MYFPSRSCEKVGESEKYTQLKAKEKYFVSKQFFRKKYLQKKPENSRTSSIKNFSRKTKTVCASRRRMAENTRKR